jgi:hypothetical protein
MTIRACPVPRGPLETLPTPALMSSAFEVGKPSWGCPRIAQQITLAFGIPINKDVVLNKDVVRRILAMRHQPDPKQT